MHFLLLFQESLMTKSLKKWLFSERTKSRKVLFLFINFVFSQQSQVTAEYPDLTLQSIHTRSLYISRHTFDSFHITEAATRRILKLST